MHTKEEISEDVDKLHDFIDSLKAKYGPEFACALSVGTGINTEITEEDDPDAFAGGAYIVGEKAMLHQACHCLLKSCKFIDGIIDAMECVILREHRKSNKPEFLDMMMVTSLESLKKILVMSTDEYKKEQENKEIDDAVSQLLRDAGLKS